MQCVEKWPFYHRLAFSGLLLFFAACAGPAYKPGLREKPTVVAPGVRHEEGRFSGVGGVRLFEQSWLPADPAKIRAAIIFVHGLKDHGDRYAAIATSLVHAGYAVYAYDQRGFGDSEGDRVSVGSFSDYVTDLSNYYGKIRGKWPNKKIFLFGHSMGGAVVTLFALRDRANLAGLVLSAPAIEKTDDVSGFKVFVTNVLGTITPSMAVFSLDDSGFSRDPKAVAAVKADPLVYDDSAPAHTAKEVLSAMDQIQSEMSQLNVPFLVMHGTKDRITNPEGSRQLFLHAKVKDKTYKSYPGYFHDLLHEPLPDRDLVAADILDWLNRRTPLAP